MTQADEGKPLPDDRHRFGSVHTKIKLDAIAKYLPAYTTALKNVPFTLHYIDAFAGTGMCDIKVAGKEIRVPGSAKIAIECAPPFHKMVFIETGLRKVKALERLGKAATGRSITIIRDDANVALPKCLSALNAQKDRAIVFLDPKGMQVEWETLRKIASTRVVDVWYLFPLSGLYRQATRNAASIDAHKAASLTRILGTDEWRPAFYAPHPQDVLFGARPAIRKVEVPQMLAWVKARLETIFAGVEGPKVLYRSGSSHQQIPIFALFFAVSNPRARDLALRIAAGVLKH